MKVLLIAFMVMVGGVLSFIYYRPLILFLGCLGVAAFGLKGAYKGEITIKGRFGIENTYEGGAAVAYGLFLALLGGFVGSFPGRIIWHDVLKLLSR
jgi:hypothetical protein